MKQFFGPLALALIAGCTSMTLQDRGPASITGPNGLSDDSLVAASSSGPLKVENAIVITDNDASFDAKLTAIRSAQSGETIRLIYYIYADDESSSAFSHELIQAAKRGVKIRLMVDFLTNYKNMDLFFAMVTKAPQNIQVKFYGVPSDLIFRDAIFMTQPCDETKAPTFVHQCSDEKWNNLKKGLQPDYYSRLLMSGIAAKNPLALRTAILVGQQIDLSKFKGSEPASPEKIEGLKEFLKLLYQAKVKGDPMAAIKAQIALMVYGEDLIPIVNELFGRLPLSQMSETSGKDWEHISDYTHHKLLLVGHRYFQLGGRNIENSYHMKRNKFSAKYTFMDTEFAADLNGGGEEIAKAYDKMWNFSPMTASIEQVYKRIPNDFVANSQAAGRALQVCEKMDRTQTAKCLQEELFKQGGLTLAERIAKVLSQMLDKREVFEGKYLPTRILPANWQSDKNYALGMSKEDYKNSIVTYIENLHFDKRKSDAKRIYGSVNGQEVFPWQWSEQSYGKNIHYLWLRGIENVCKQSSADGKPRRIVLHSAYFLPPANLLRVMTKMIDGSWDCHKVSVTFLTNSFETTDLNIINVFARHQMNAFYDIYRNRDKHFGLTGQQRGAKFEYFEYLPQAEGISLHTKVSVLGDDMIIGSANADVRSYFADTNNGVYIQGATGLTQEYLKSLDHLLGNSKLTKNLAPGYLSGKITRETLHAEDNQMIDLLLAKYVHNQALADKIRPRAQKTMSQFTDVIYNLTTKIMSAEYIDVYDGETYQQDQEKLKLQKEYVAEFNRIMQLL